VTKVNPAGSALLYSTYLGGSGGDVGLGIAVDGSGNAHVTGTTGSANFPTANPIQPASGGIFDAFVTKVNPAGFALLYSTYLGGSGSDFGLGIAVDGSGNAYVTGGTGSATFPTVNAFQPAFGGGSLDAFIAQISGPAQAIQTLIDTINGMGLPPGVQASLLAPLNQAINLLNDNNPNNDVSVCNRLDAFIIEVGTKELNGQLTAAQADELGASANAIKAALGCP
jgi:hypothetical protein